MLDANKMPNLFNLLSLADVIDPATKVHDEDSDTDVELVPLIRAAAEEVAAV